MNENGLLEYWQILQDGGFVRRFDYGKSTGKKRLLQPPP
jgi:hypothetical protein